MKQIFICIIYLTLLFVLFSGCSGMEKKHLTGNYYLIKMDYADEELSLSYKDGSVVIRPTIFAVGYDEDFIIVKQHPSKFGKELDKSITNCYIIPLKYEVNKWPDKNKIGPLTEEEFLLKRKELNISDELKFISVNREYE